MKTVGALNKDTLKIIAAASQIITPSNPTTVRFVLYKLISQGVLSSTTQYGKLVNILRDARIRGDIADECFIDNKRTTLQVPSHADLNEYLDSVKDGYARDLWAEQPKRVEILVEKGTVGNVLKPVANEKRVPLRISSGYYSRPFLCRIADDIVSDNKPAVVGYVGDFDPSGFDIERAARRGGGFGSACREGLYDLIEQRGFSEIEWHRIAVTSDDFDDLPDVAKVPVKTGDTRKSDYASKYGEFGAEVEALDQTILQDRVRDFIDEHTDNDLWDKSTAVETQDESKLANLSF